MALSHAIVLELHRLHHERHEDDFNWTITPSFPVYQAVGTYIDEAFLRQVYTSYASTGSAELVFRILQSGCDGQVASSV